MKEVGFAEQEYVDEHGMAEHAQHDCATAAEFQSTHVSIREVEEYQVGPSGVTVLELVINPNIGGGVAHASLKDLRLS